jgi:cystathionine beta-synthase
VAAIVSNTASRQVSVVSRLRVCCQPVPKKICDSILDAIGNTPMVRINRLTRGVIDATVLVKLETFNPGNSTKDRMAVKMIEDAERAGLLKPGGTIVEGTSGNTGMGLAIVAVVKGYKCVFTTTDKQSKEKIDALKAFGAEVIVCPTNVDPDDPRSYYSVSSRLVSELPNAWKANQYDNLSNLQAHYEQTGPEIWDQTDGKITHLVVGVGTGGTVTGVGRYLKERNPAIRVWGIDTYGSVFKKYKETGIFDKQEIYPYITEGIGEDFLPRNVDFSVIDHFEKVTDKDAAVMTRRIAREEGIWAGNSAGAAMAGLLQLKEHFRKDDVVVVIFHDHGSRYLGKMFNDDWMRQKGFIEKTGVTARELLASGVSGELFSVEAREPVSNAVRVMSEHDFSQISITRDKRLVGSLDESHLFAEITKNPAVRSEPVETIMQPAFPFVDISTPVELLATMVTPENPAVLVRDFKTDKTFIITRSDIIRALA